MEANGTETYNDGNVKVSIVLNHRGAALVEVENLTDKIIFVDRGRSFVLVNRQSEPLFLMQSTTNSQTYMKGMTVNEYDTQWMSGETHTKSQTMYDQRIQAVAPHGTAIVYAWEQLPQLLNPEIIHIGNKGKMYSSQSKGWFEDKRHKFRKGDKRRYIRENSPLVLGADIEYSFKEFGEPEARISISDYVSKIWVDSRDGVSSDGELKADRWHYGPCFAFRSGKSTATVVGEGFGWLQLVGLIALAVAINDADDMDMPSGW
jgi:hypothetical protein